MVSVTVISTAEQHFSLGDVSPAPMLLGIGFCQESFPQAGETKAPGEAHCFLFHLLDEGRV